MRSSARGMRPDSDDVDSVFGALGDDDTDLGRTDVQSNDEILTAIHVPPLFCESPLETFARRALGTPARTAGSTGRSRSGRRRESTLRRRLFRPVLRTVHRAEPPVLRSEDPVFRRPWTSSSRPVSSSSSQISRVATRSASWPSRIRAVSGSRSRNAKPVGIVLRRNLTVRVGRGRSNSGRRYASSIAAREIARSRRRSQTAVAPSAQAPAGPRRATRSSSGCERHSLRRPPRSRLAGFADRDQAHRGAYSLHVHHEQSAPVGSRTALASAIQGSAAINLASPPARRVDRQTELGARRETPSTRAIGVEASGALDRRAREIASTGVAPASPPIHAAAGRRRRSGCRRARRSSAPADGARSETTIDKGGCGRSSLRIRDRGVCGAGAAGAASIRSARCEVRSTESIESARADPAGGTRSWFASR